MTRRRRFSTDAFGETMQALMDETGVTYRGLAERTGLSAGYLNHLVHGNRPVPSNDVLASLANQVSEQQAPQPAATHDAAPDQQPYQPPILASALALIVTFFVIFTPLAEQVRE